MTNIIVIEFKSYTVASVSKELGIPVQILQSEIDFYCKDKNLSAFGINKNFCSFVLPKVKILQLSGYEGGLGSHWPWDPFLPVKFDRCGAYFGVSRYAIPPALYSVFGVHLANLTSARPIRTNRPGPRWRNW